MAKNKILSRYKNILDIGCYSGVFLREMANIKHINGKFICVGMDIHKELMDILSKQNPDIVFKFGLAESIPFESKSFDVVTAFDVLEHVLNFWGALDEIERVCKKGGLILINLPRMTIGYKDESGEHLRMFDDNMINSNWGHKKDFKFEFCNDELGRPTSFISYTNV